MIRPLIAALLIAALIAIGGNHIAPLLGVERFTVPVTEPTPQAPATSPRPQARECAGTVTNNPAIQDWRRSIGC